MPNKYVINTDCTKRTITSKDYLDQHRTDEQDTSLSYLCPLISNLMHDLETESERSQRQLDEIGYIKEIKTRATNGPKLLIVCGSCRNAQRIHEIIIDMIEILHRNRCRDFVYNKRIGIKKLRVILLQGGNYEDMYDVPLMNGCDILISSTPFCLLRMLGLKKTNLERMKHMVLDEAYLLIEKFPTQMRVLMSCYSDVLNLCSDKTFSQFVVFSSLWSIKLKKFIEKFIHKPGVVLDNKLEASFYGQTQHILDECTSSTNKMKKIQNILTKCCADNKNTIIFTPNDQCTLDIKDDLVTKFGYANVNTIVEKLHESKIHEIEEKWATWDSADKNELINKRLNTNLILICSENSIKYVNISTAKSVVHYDFPS